MTVKIKNKSQPQTLASLFDLTRLRIERRKKYVKNEFQAYGLMLAEELSDWKNKSLYIRLAKTHPPELLEKARLFVKDQTQGQVKSKARLFMWKLKELKDELKKQS
jgi:hypothetical protein